MKKKDIAKIANILTGVRHVAVVSHYNPDGDAIGSALALWHFFMQKGIDAQVVLPNPFPDFLAWLPGAEHIVVAEKNKTKARNAIAGADLLFVVDMNAAHRAGQEVEPMIEQCQAFKVLIDHHVLPELPCDLSYSTTQTSSTCELLYRFLFDELKCKDQLTHALSTCLYTGIITDTGSLSYSCNNPYTYLILSKLLKTGINGEDIHRLVYDNYEASRLRLLGLSLSRRMKILPEYATAYIFLSSEDLKENYYKIGDTEGFVNYGLSLKNVQFAAIFIQREKKVRVSFRSKGNFDVNLFARTHFNGGGHRNASAAYCDLPLSETVAFFESLLPQYQEILTRPYPQNQISIVHAKNKS
ncbi:MAG: DHH family phosphoesterase [Bacteroidales bacterium]|nr:DHH family phosphoesterase [Bacteroidales bacterium]